MREVTTSRLIHLLTTQAVPKKRIVLDSGEWIELFDTLTEMGLVDSLCNSHRNWLLANTDAPLDVIDTYIMLKKTSSM